jgi:hypothetical protein
MSDTQFPIPEQLGHAFSRVSEVLRGCSGDALGDGLSVVCRASFGVLRPARVPLRGYYRTIDGSEGRGASVCVKLVDRRGNITMNGVIEWFLVGSTHSRRRYP